LNVDISRTEMESQLMHIIKREWSFIMSLICLISSLLLDALVKISIARFYFRFQDTILFISFGILIVASLLYRKFYTSSEKKLTISQVQNCIWPAFLMYISFYLRLYHARYDARYFQALRIASFYAPMFTLTLKKLILRHEILFFEIYLAIYVLFCGILANYGIFSLLSLRHYAVSIIYCTSNSICFAWAELIKRQPSQDKSDVFCALSVCLFILSYFGFMLNENLTNVISYLTFNTNHAFLYLVYCILFLIIAWFIFITFYSCCSKSAFTTTIILAGVPSVQLWLSFLAPMEYALIDAWPSKLNIFAHFFQLFGITTYFQYNCK
ncbi:hypothetical protein T4A_13169, partial [Trichinella pseudospiralis]